MSLPEPYYNSDKSSFAHTSVTKRWPAIIKAAISDLHQASNDLREGPQKQETSRLEQSLTKILSDVEEGVEIKPFSSHLSENDKIYNEELAKLPENQRLWTEAPWLFSECYLYRALQRAVEATEHWKKYDIFSRVKQDTLEKSADSVSSLAKRYITTSEQLQQTAQQQKTSQEVIRTLLKEVLDTSLWGNATDLSLLVTISMEQIKKLQVASDSRDKESVLVNDFAAIEKELTSIMGSGRVDIVLDNSGFELYTDLILALFLLDAGIAEQVVCHGKAQPWFVSDVTRDDWLHIITALGDHVKFPQERIALSQLIEKIISYSSEGCLVFRDELFWTTPLSFHEIKKGGNGGGGEVWQSLRDSKLVIFKGDLNYRKLTGDLQWPHATKFGHAIQDLDLKLATLRTIKADVCVGLEQGQDEILDSKWVQEHPSEPKQAWAWSGSYAVVSYHSKY